MTLTSDKINPRRDGDAYFVLLISIITMLASFGFSYVVLFYRIWKTAKQSATQIDDPTAVVFLFGKRLRNNRPDSDYESRLQRVLVCGNQSVIIMGGKTGGHDLSEAQAGLNYLHELGADTKNYQLEQDSASTLENLRNARELLEQNSVIIITNRYHLARCSAFADSLAIPHQLCAAEATLTFDLRNVSKCLLETFFLHWFLAGKYWATLFNNQRMLNKIR